MQVVVNSKQLNGKHHRTTTTVNILHSRATNTNTIMTLYKTLNIKQEKNIAFLTAMPETTYKDTHNPHANDK